MPNPSESDRREAQSDSEPHHEDVKASARERAFDPTALIEEGQALVYSIANNVARSLPVPIDREDLIAYGQLGLAEAAQAFDPSAKTKFTTFAYYRIRGAIYDGVSKMTWTSRARLRRLRFQQMADEVIESEADSGDSLSDDAAWLGRVSERLAVVFLASGEDESSQLDGATDPHETPSVRVASREMQSKLRKTVDKLSPEAKRLITFIYFDGFTLTQAAERAGISKSWASRLHASSLDELAKTMRALGAD